MDLKRREFLRMLPWAGLAGVSPLTQVAMAAGASGQPPILGRSRRKPRPGDGVGILDLGMRTSARILQFTDIHFFGNSDGRKPSQTDEWTVEDWHSFVRHIAPDLILVTGDIWHNNPRGRGMFALEHAVRELERLDVPWATCWGNHDRLDDYQLGHDTLEGARGSIYRGGSTHGDYRIELRSRGGTLCRRLFVMNSHRWGLAAWQLEWLKGQLTSTTGPALAFFHIPVMEQKTLYQPGVTPGVRAERVCHELELGSALPVIEMGGSVRACFCGHDHVNDYAVGRNSVGLVYGRATGYTGYGGDIVRKGAKFIEFDLVQGEYRAETVFADGSRWAGV